MQLRAAVLQVAQRCGECTTLLLVVELVLGVVAWPSRHDFQDLLGQNVQVGGRQVILFCVDAQDATEKLLAGWVNERRCRPLRSYAESA
jgi:hypothetical protein